MRARRALPLAVDGSKQLDPRPAEPVQSHVNDCFMENEYVPGSGCFWLTYVIIWDGVDACANPTTEAPRS